MVPGYLLPADLWGPTDEYQLAQVVCSHPGLGSLGAPVKREVLAFHCNNASVVHIMAKASTCSKTMVALVHTFMLLAMQYNVQVHIQHIAGVCNDIADVLSHFEMHRFWQLCPHAEPGPLTPANIW